MLVRSTARGHRENIAFLLGSENRRCLTCDCRFICFQKMAFAGYSMPDARNPRNLAWPAISSGLVMCLSIAWWVLHKFHRLP